MKTDIAYIYCLIDPRNGEVRYIGKTVNPLTRKYQHVCKQSKDEDNFRTRWINKLLKLKLKPIFKVLEVCSIDQFELRETYYISVYKSEKLTNSDDTGQGYGRRIQSVIEKSNFNRKNLYQFDLSGNFIKEWKSTREASRHLGISHGNISKCCNGIWRHSNGFIFRYNKDCKIDPIDVPNAVKKSVSEIDKDRNVLKSWKCLMDCSRETGINNGNLSRVCNGINKSVYGRYFIFN
jgi:hypothetical protein